MLRLSKLADYGIVLLSYFAQSEQAELTARQLAGLARLPLPTVSKVLKALCRAGLLMSQRGVSGGYRLARQARQISVVEMIAALDGPIALTQCSASAPGLCELEAACPVRGNWQRLNQVVVQALKQLSLSDMQTPQRLSNAAGLTLVPRQAAKQATP